MLDNLKIEIDKFRKAVITQSRSNLTRLQKNSSKKLYNSLKSDLKVSKNSFQLDFSMEKYGEFQDKGVSGKKVKYDTEFSYKSKMPPPSKLDKWIVKRGLAPRTKGKFTGRTINSVGFQKSIQFLIARSIYNKGIKPSLFFTKPFNNEYKKLSDNLIEAFGLDMEQFMKYTLTNYKK